MGGGVGLRVKNIKEVESILSDAILLHLVIVDMTSPRRIHAFHRNSGATSSLVLIEHTKWTQYLFPVPGSFLRFSIPRSSYF